MEDRLWSLGTALVRAETEVRLSKREPEIARLNAHEITARDIANAPHLAGDG